MAGTAYHAEDIAPDAPGRVRPVPTYWSFNYASVHTQYILLMFMLVAGVLSVHHSRPWASLRVCFSWLRSRDDRDDGGAPEVRRAHARVDGHVVEPLAARD